MDGSIVNVALPTLAVQLPGASNSGLQWIVDAYILSFASLLLVAGSAADRFGRRRVLLLGLAFFALMSVGATTAQTLGSLVLWRALMGVGAAMIFPSTLAIICDEFAEPRLRRTAIAVWAGSSGLGVAVGPLAGGWLLEHAGWSSVFLVNIPIALLAGIGVWSFARESIEDARRRPDFLGAVLSISGVLLLVWGLIEAPERGWLSPLSLAALAVGCALVWLFVLWERRAADPMLDVSYFLDRSFAAGCLAIAAAFFGLFGFVFMATQYFQFVRGFTALETGLRTTPFAVFILTGSLAAASVSRMLRPRGLIAIGLVLMSIGFASATLTGADTHYGLILMQMLVLGCGFGMVNATATEAVMGTLPPSKTGVGSSVNDTLREVGGTLGVAGMGSAFNALYRAGCADGLASSPLPSEIRSVVQSSAGAAAAVAQRIETLAGHEAAERLRHVYREAFLSGLSAGCWIACGITAAAAFATLWLLRTGLQSVQEDHARR